MDQGAGQLYPQFDHATGLCCVIGKGDKIVRFYELNFLAEKSLSAGGLSAGGLSAGNRGGETAPGDDSWDLGGGAGVEKCNEYATQDEPFSGMCLLPARMCNVRSVEVLRILKLAGDTVCPVSFSVPRADHLKPFFQDDLYREVPGREPAYAVADWSRASGGSASSSTGGGGGGSGSGTGSAEEVDMNAALKYSFPPRFESLRPADMTPLSHRTTEEANLPSKSKNATFREEIQKSKAETQSRDGEFSRLQALAVQRSLYHPNMSSSSSSANAPQEGVAISAASTAGAAVTAPKTTPATALLHRPLSRCVDATPVYDEPDSDDEDRWND